MPIVSATPLEWLAATALALALLHTFSVAKFERWSHAHPKHAGLWHVLAEVEVVFGLWAMVFLLCWAGLEGASAPLDYLDGRNFTEPLFVLAIMAVSASRPVLQAARQAVESIARCLPFSPALAWVFTVLGVVPLLGSFITEPAAMTLAVLLLRDTVFARLPDRVRYAVLGVLLVNVSVGGTLTTFAAPPVLMVAQAWQLDMAYMWQHIGSKAVWVVGCNSALVCALFAKEWPRAWQPVATPVRAVPLGFVLLHLLLLSAVVVLSHHPAAFLGVFLLFLGLATAYPQHHTRLLLRESLLVAFFLAGLVVLGGMQRWWLEPLLRAMSDTQVFWGAVALTAVTDNAALTYLGSLVPGLSPEFRYALLTGAVTGGGLTLVANAPNPAAAALLKSHFDGGAIGAGALLRAACGPTLVAVLGFRALPW